MLNKTEFSKLRGELESTNTKRENVIQASRVIISISKQIIYAVQRNDLSAASNLIRQINSRINELRKYKLPLDTNIHSVAYQEYVEAICFYEFVRNGTLCSYKNLKVTPEDYLAGICDLTGELVRKAIFNVINNKPKEAVRIKNLVAEIYGEFLKLDLRNGELRKKADSIKWNLMKLEDVIYDISIKGKSC